MVTQSLRNQIEQLPNSPGVYIFRTNKGEVLYVGKSIHLRERVKSYFRNFTQLGRKTAHMVKKIRQISHIQTESELEALLLEADLIKQFTPTYNIQWKDDKRYKYIEISNYQLRANQQKSKPNEPFNRWPHVTTARRANNPNSLYFGPFPNGKTVSQVLKTLRQVFPWCQYKSQAVQKRAGRPCFYYHIQQCPGICAQKISLQAYWEIIDELADFLRGRKNSLLAKYKALMQKATHRHEFELAAQYRDKIAQLEYVTQRFRDTAEYLRNPNLVQDLRAQEVENLVHELNKARLGNNYPPTKRQAQHLLKPVAGFRIEAYDVSNLGANYTTASRVVFINAEPDKSQYRRYRLKTRRTPNDVAAMREVLRRRFKNYAAAKTKRATTSLPQLILIDGGQNQLRAALEVLQNQHLPILTIGLAKREEEIIIPIKENEPQAALLPFGSAERFRAIRLPKNSPALHLLQRIRDEAHRFARNYHRYLRRRGMINR